MRYQRSTPAYVLAGVCVPLLCVVLLFIAPSAASAATTTFVMTESGDFGTLNLTTGAFTKLGNSGVTPAGMGELGSNLYIGGDQNGTLYQVNLSDGAVTTIGSASITYRAFGATTASLYAVDVTNNNLYSINAATGGATLIGSTGINPTTSDTAMSADAGVLYFTMDTGSGSILYLINTSTGAAAMIGSTGVSKIESMVYQNSLLYAATLGGALYTLDPTTGKPTFIANTGIAPFGIAEPASVFKDLHNFSGGLDGGTPKAGVTLDKAGENLYGTTYAYGAHDYGAVYQLKLKGGTLNPIYGFTGGSDGANPLARVIFGPDGTLYGTAEFGGKGYGTVFNLRPYATVCKTTICPWMGTLLYTFKGSPDGAYPLYGDLLFLASNIYGTTDQGGNDNIGTVYELTHSGSGWTETVIYSFGGGSDGDGPDGGVIPDGVGNLYGTTDLGGINGGGTVFQLMPPNGPPPWPENLLHSFGGNGGVFAEAGLIFDPSGNLWGVTTAGGTGGGGEVFEMTDIGDNNWSYTPIYGLTGNSGCGPYHSLVMDSAGNLYGATYCDGAYGYGNVFELTYPNWTYIDLYDFCSAGPPCIDGEYPITQVTLDGNGNLYGTTSAGGLQGVGVVWELEKN